jgi:hypothetical protein
MRRDALSTPSSINPTYHHRAPLSRGRTPPHTTSDEAKPQLKKVEAHKQYPAWQADALDEQKQKKNVDKSGIRLDER